jgi:hypothetical protein
MNYESRRWWREQWRLLAWLVVVAAALVILLGGVIAPARAGAAWDFEVGEQLAPRPGPYVSARVNLSLGEIPAIGTGFWVVPEAGAVFSSPAEWYGRVQLLADTPIGTVGGEVRTGEEAAVTRVFVRFGW